MTENENKVLTAMLEFDKGDTKRIQHFIKVNAFACYIAYCENLSKSEQEIISLAAYVHDIGIHAAEQKYNSTAGKYQELEGPPLAEKLLKNCNIPDDITKRICFLVGHHHTYKNIDSIDWQILVEADFIVNMYEDSTSETGIKNAYNKIFKTQTGKKVLQENFGLIN